MLNEQKYKQYLIEERIMISSAQARILLTLPTHSMAFSAFSCSVQRR
jgi:hypothetical protein